MAPVPPRRPGQPSSPELEFSRRWRPLIDRVGGDGGQARAAKSLNWTTSTVSRDYKGDTLPTDERLLQLGHALQLPDRELLDLAALLRRARVGRRDRLRASRAESSDPVPGTAPAASGESAPAVTIAWPAPGLVSPSGPASVPSLPYDAGPLPGAGLAHSPGGQHAAGRPAWFRGRRRLAAALSAAALSAVVAAVVIFVVSGSGAPPKPATRAKPPSGAGPVAKGTFPGLALESVRIPVRSLSPALAAQFRQGRTQRAGVDVDVSWNSSSLHNGAKLAILVSVKLSNGKSHGIVALVVSKAASWPGHPAFGGEYRAQVYTPGHVHVVQGHIQSWISNGGVPYSDPTGSGDTITLRQFRRC